MVGRLALSLSGYLAGLTVSQGPGRGKRLKLMPWERDLVAMFDAPGDLALTIARKNGENDVGCRDCGCDPGRSAGAAPHGHCACGRVAAAGEDCVRPCTRIPGRTLKDHKRWRVVNSTNIALIEDRGSGAKLFCVGCKPETIHGLAVGLAILDEPAQWPPNVRDKVLAAVRTSAGAADSFRMVALGTRPDDDAHWFGRMLKGDRALVYQAEVECDPMAEDSWKAANPSWGYFPALRAAIRTEAKAAALDPMQLASFKALRLNLGTADTMSACLMEAADWKRMEVEAVTIDGGYLLGIDLGSGASMSAAAAYDPGSGALDYVAALPESPSLARRGIADGVGTLYLEMLASGDLIQAGGRVADVNALIAEARHRWGDPVAVVCDRWREADLRQSLDAIGFPLGVRVVTRGQGFKDGAEDVRKFRAACLSGEVHPRRSLMARSAMREARVKSDPAGNVKLCKKNEGGRRQLARDDVAAAAIIAVAEGARMGAVSAAPRRRRFAVAR